MAQIALHTLTTAPRFFDTAQRHGSSRHATRFVGFADHWNAAINGRISTIHAEFLDFAHRVVVFPREAGWVDCPMFVAQRVTARGFALV